MIIKKDREHVIIGEAAMDLILENEEVTVVSLVRQLDAMAAGEPDNGRLAAINAAYLSLTDFRLQDRLSTQGSPWFVLSGGTNEEQYQILPGQHLLRQSGDGTLR